MAGTGFNPGRVAGGVPDKSLIYYNIKNYNKITNFGPIYQRGDESTSSGENRREFRYRAGMKR
jgi:hypothetical protein